MEVRAAFIVAAIEVDDLRDAGLFGGIAKGVQNLPGQALMFDAPFPVGAMHFVGCRHGRMIFRSFEIGQHVIPTPALISELAPMVVVAGLAAHIDHSIDGRTATQYTPSRIAQTAAVQPGIRRRPVPPVRARVVHAVEIADGNVDPDVVIPAAGLQKQNRNVRIRGQAIGKHAAGRACAYDDIVVTSRNPVPFHRLALPDSRAKAIPYAGRICSGGATIAAAGQG